MKNNQYNKVLQLAQDQNLDLRACPTCRGRYTELAPGIWHWPSSTYRYLGEEYECNCEWQDKLRRHYLLAGIPMNYWPLSEDDFFGDQEARDATQEYLDSWVDWKWHGIGLAFHSVTQGTGKTMLATIVARHLIHMGERVHFIAFRDAVQVFGKPQEQREHEERLLRNTPVLVLDEVGPGISAAQSGLYAVQLEDLIRYRTGGNNVTILTTNMTTEALDEEYPRTFSLLAHKQRHIEVKGHDVRRGGEVDLFVQELIANKEAKPIV